jgi:hypothetical protein
MLYFEIILCTDNDYKPKIRGTYLPPGPFPLQFLTVKYNMNTIMLWQVNVSKK